MHLTCGQRCVVLPTVRKTLAFLTVVGVMTAVPVGAAPPRDGVAAELSCSNASAAVLFYPSALAPSQVGANGATTCSHNLSGVHTLCAQVSLLRSGNRVASKVACKSARPGVGVRLSAATGTVLYRAPNSAYGANVVGYLG